MTVRKEKREGGGKKEKKHKRQKRNGGKLKGTRMGEEMEGKAARMEGGRRRCAMKPQSIGA